MEEREYFLNFINSAIKENKIKFWRAILECIENEIKRAIVFIACNLGFCHIQGIIKITGYNPPAIINDVNFLFRHNVLRRLEKEEKHRARKYARLFEIEDDYHFNKAEFYEINPELKEFFNAIDWNGLIDARIKEKVEKGKKFLEPPARQPMPSMSGSMGGGLQKSDNLEEKARQFINAIHRKAVELFGNEYEKYGNEWAKARKLIKMAKIQQLQGMEITELNGIGEAIKKCIFEENPAEIVEFIKRGGKITMVWDNL
ncbi:MAG: hypothetical protein QW519_04380 [Candidatus Thermoplasmatota archaeon]